MRQLSQRWALGDSLQASQVQNEEHPSLGWIGTLAQVLKLGISMTHLTVPQLVDCLAVMSHSRSTSTDAMSGNFTLQALRWFRKIAGVSCLELVFSPLADSFLKVRSTADKKEAPPLPLWILFHWEKRILYSQSTLYEVIMLGGFLFILWSGLRFSDAQRLNVS